MQTLPASRAFALREFPLAAGLALLTFLVSAYFAPRGFRGGFTDMAHDGYQLRQVLDLDQGGTIFKDTFDQYGPLSGYLNLAAYRMLGRRLLAIKYAFCVWYAAIAILLYRLARHLLPPAWSAVSVVLWLALAPFYQHGIMVTPHAYVLFFQSLAMLAVIEFAETDRLVWMAVAGVCCGWSWALKQMMGALFAAGVIGYLSSGPSRGERSVPRTLVAVATLLGCFAAIVAATLLWLWTHGAVHDWFLQAVAFPRRFYLEQWAGGSVPRGALSVAALFIRTFLQLNLDRTNVPVALYWHLIRFTVVGGTMWLLWRRQAPEALIVAAFITPVMWLGAYPSANYMHQWWTASPGISAFMYCVVMVVPFAVARWTTIGPEKTRWLTVSILAIVFAQGFGERIHAARQRAVDLTETINEPRVISGIRTDKQTLAGLGALYGAMLNFKQHHPSARVVSIDHCDGFSNCVPESLLWLSFFEDNPHDLPIYWPLPVLSTTLYADYQSRFLGSVRSMQPLIVDSWSGQPGPKVSLAGYTPLVMVIGESENWLLYAPVHEEARAHGEVLITLDTIPELPVVALLNAAPPDPVRIVEPEISEVALFGVRRDPVKIADPQTGVTRQVPLYTWPPDINVPDLLPEPPLLDATGAERAAIVTMDGGRWIVRGSAESRYSYLLKFKEQPVDSGDYFVATGHLEEGGFTLGLLRDGKWAGEANVQAPGPFAVVLMPPDPTDYSLVLANNVTTTWRQLIRKYPVRALWKLVTRATLPNTFRVDRAGWVRSSAIGDPVPARGSAPAIATTSR